MFKKAVTVVLAAAMAASIAACGSSSGSGSSSTNSSSASAPASASGDAIKLTLAMVDNEQSNYYKGAQAIAKEVSDATNGQITIDIKAGGTLGGEADTLDMAIQGDLDIATAANSVLENYIPEMAILDQAFLWDSQDQANYAVTHELGDLIQEKANAQGLHVVGYMESGFRDVFSKKPIQSVDDFKGLLQILGVLRERPIEFIQILIEVSQRAYDITAHLGEQIALNPRQKLIAPFLICRDRFLGMTCADDCQYNANQAGYHSDSNTSEKMLNTL